MRAKLIKQTGSIDCDYFAIELNIEQESGIVHPSMHGKPILKLSAFDYSIPGVEKILNLIVDKINNSEGNK